MYRNTLPQKHLRLLYNESDTRVLAEHSSQPLCAHHRQQHLSANMSRRSDDSEGDEYDDGIDGASVGSKRMVHQPIGRVADGGSSQQRFSSSSSHTKPSSLGVPISVPTERLVRNNPYFAGGAIGTPLTQRSMGGSNAGGGAIASSQPTMVVNHNTELPTHYELRSRAHGGVDPSAQLVVDDELYEKDNTQAVEMDDMTSHQHNVLAHLMHNSSHDVLRPTEDNIMYSRRLYIYPDHSFFNACMLLTVIGALMAFSTAFVAVVVIVCQIEVDLYWYRTIYIIMGFIIGLALVAITMLHIYRHRSFSKNHVISITMPAIVFVVGSVMVGFGLQWYVSTHGSTIHWHSAAQMSTLSNILLMNFAWGIAMISISARALGCHWVAEQIDPQTTVELSFTNDEVQASTTFRNAARMARVGMGASAAGGSVSAMQNPAKLGAVK